MTRQKLDMFAIILLLLAAEIALATYAISPS